MPPSSSSPGTCFSALSRLQQGLAQLEADEVLRSRLLLESPQGVNVRVNGRDVISFCSNDYLGLANEPALTAAAEQLLRQCGLGAGASHLITGHHVLHQQFEDAFAAFVGKPAALLFSTGYMANLGVLTALLDRHGEVFADKLNHASLNDAAQLCGATFSRYGHGNIDQLESLLAKSRERTKLIVSDLVFSMDGDIVDVDGLLSLAERYDAWLFLDDAHGFGVLNDGRGGLTQAARQSDRVIYLATLGKAAGVFGAALAAHQSVIQWLVQKARPYVYTTAMPPLLAGALLESLKLIQAGGARRDRLRRHVAALRRGLADWPRWQLLHSTTPIQPLVVGSNANAVNVSKKLLERGLLVPAIRTPTVPRNTARLRITLSSAHREEDIVRLCDALHEIAET
ncbi:MAG: 8-amino-7-oxononanoate synthase [Hydrogenophilaceae bacterium]|nr:8-amino-7-oxononanoate synthase [Hydrogenophilaceae bacterium]